MTIQSGGIAADKTLSDAGNFRKPENLVFFCEKEYKVFDMLSPVGTTDNSAGIYSRAKAGETMSKADNNAERVWSDGEYE